MSIVIGAVTGNHAWIMSDGRQCNAADKSVIREDLPKFEMINEGLYIGYTKGYESAMEAMQDFKAICPNIKNATVDDAIEILQSIMTSPRIGKPRLNAQFIAVGRAAAGGMAVGTVNEYGEVKGRGVYGPDEMIFNILHDKEPIDLAQQVEARLKNAQPLGVAIEEGMKAVIRAQAERDPTVNAVIYQARI